MRTTLVTVLLLLLLAQFAVAQDGEYIELADISITGRAQAPTAVSFLLRTDPDFGTVMLRQTYASQILNPIDKEEFEEGLAVTQRTIDNPLLWLATGAALLSGIAAGYMDSNGETENAGWLAGGSGVAISAAAVIILID